jgi:hypothetical protein
MHQTTAGNGTSPGWFRAVATLAFAAIIVLGLSPGSSFAHAADGHPARIHAGTCQSLGPVDFSLTGVGASVDLDGNPIATPQAVNSDKAYQVMTSESTIATTIEELLASDHAVMLYDNDEDMQAIACGNVGGAMFGDSLVVGLGEAGTPGHVGFALFQPDGEQTDVTMFLGHAMSPVSAGGTMPAVTDMSGDSSHQHESEASHEDMATPEA